MIVTKKALSRRTVLRGLGAAFALPLLDSMVPALSAFSNTAAPQRFGAIYVPNGIMMANWTPKTVGSAFEFTPTLKPLERFRDRLLVVSGLNSKPQISAANLPMGLHSRASTRFLTDVQPKPVEGADLAAGISVDQIVARELGKYTQLASLELSLDSADSGGAGDAGFSRVYVDTISWRSATTPLPMENNPRTVFERMFGDSSNTDPATRKARLEEDRSILDSVVQTAAELQRGLGSSDRSKLGEYFDSIRDVERRIQRAEQENLQDLPVVPRPAGIPAAFEEHIKLMYDLCLLAYQCDLTRVVTFMIGHELSGRSYPQLGISDAHHPISHHQGDPVRLAKLAKIDEYHTSMLAYFLEKMRSTADGDGSLLDHSMIVYGGGMSDGNTHDPKNLPILVAGGGNGRLKGGRHIQADKDSPLANLHLSLLEKMGVPLDKIGDSSSNFAPLST